MDLQGLIFYKKVCVVGAVGKGGFAGFFEGTFGKSGVQDVVIRW
jgi:hypothetical protein